MSLSYLLGGENHTLFHAWIQCQAECPDAGPGNRGNPSSAPPKRHLLFPAKRVHHDAGAKSKARQQRGLTPASLCFLPSPASAPGRMWGKCFCSLEAELLRLLHVLRAAGEERRAVKCSCSIQHRLQQQEQGKAGTGSQFSQICAMGQLILRLCAPTVVGIQHKATGEGKCCLTLAKSLENWRSERRAASLSSLATSSLSPTSAC